MLAALAPGEREIPERLVRFVTRERPGCPLLLLCRESLVRPTVTLQNGRVTLVEPPFSVRRIASRLRVMLAPPDGGDAPSAEVEPHGLAVHEHQRTAHWVGALSDGSAERASWLDQSRGLTVLVPDEGLAATTRGSRPASTSCSPSGPTARLSQPRWPTSSAPGVADPPLPARRRVAGVTGRGWPGGCGCARRSGCRPAGTSPPPPRSVRPLPARARRRGDVVMVLPPGRPSWARRRGPAWRRWRRPS